MPHVETMIDGVWYPSVTTVLGAKTKPWLAKWRDKWGVLAERKTAAANAVGTAFHDGAERLSRGELVEAPTIRLHKMLERFEAWRIENGFVPLEQELRVISRLYQYSGTFDATGYLAADAKRLVLFDWKTSSGIYPDMALQLVAYCQAYYEQTQRRITHGIIVHVNKDKPHHKLTVKEYEFSEALLEEFLERLEEFREFNDPVKVVTK